MATRRGPWTRGVGVDRGVFRRRARLMTGLVLAGLCMGDTAHAVIPSLVGPLQALWASLAQLLPLAGGLLAGLLGLHAWRRAPRRQMRPGWLWLGVGVLGLGLVAILVVGRVPDRPAAPATPAGDSAPAARAPADAAGSVAPAADWPAYGGSARRNGCLDERPLPPELGLCWTFTDPDVTLADFVSSPAVASGRVYFGAASASVFRRTGAVYCLDAASGRLLWRTATAQQVCSSPAVSGGRVFVGEGFHEDSGSALRCLDAATGVVIWEFRSGSHIESSPLVLATRVYVGAGADGVYCLDAASGAVRWHVAGYHVDSAPALAAARVFFGSGYTQNAFVAVDAASGARLWAVPTPYPAWGHPAATADAVWFAASNLSLNAAATATPQSTVYCLDAGTGRERWRREIAAGVSAAVVLAGDRALVACWDGAVLCVDAATGRDRWRADTGTSRLYGSPAVAGDRVYALAEDGRLFCLALDTGQGHGELALAHLAGGKAPALSSPALAAGRLFAGLAGNRFVCVGGPGDGTAPQPCR